MAKMKTSRNRKTCSVFGCLNSTTENPDMAFFSLPSKPERLSAWLTLIDREDLANKPERHYRVCEVHFEGRSIIVTSNRKVLKKNAVPSLCLPQTSQFKKDKAVQVGLDASLPDVFKLKFRSRDGAELICTEDQDDDTPLLCDEERTTLIDATGKALGRIHEGFQCNMCKAEISGFRYTCVQCADYDLCCACEARGEHARHYVLRVPGPRPYMEARSVRERIRRELMSGVLHAAPTDAEIGLDATGSDSVKPEVKVEVEEVIDPGPDPLVEAVVPEDESAPPLQSERKALCIVGGPAPCSAAPVDMSHIRQDLERSTHQGTEDNTSIQKWKPSGTEASSLFGDASQNRRVVDVAAPLTPQRGTTPLSIQTRGGVVSRRDSQKALHSVSSDFEVFTHSSASNFLNYKNKKRKELTMESPYNKRTFL